MPRLRTISAPLLLLFCLGLSGCVGTIVGTAVDVGIEVAKVPFKVGAAVVDVATDDDDEEQAEEDADD